MTTINTPTHKMVLFMVGHDQHVTVIPNYNAVDDDEVIPEMAISTIAEAHRKFYGEEPASIEQRIIGPSGLLAGKKIGIVICRCANPAKGIEVNEPEIVTSNNQQ